MQVGCLGQIPFYVNSETVQTLDKVAWSGAAQIATHERHGYHALTEYTGMTPDKFSFEMFLSALLGVDPMQLLVQLWNYERDGIAAPLTIGNHAYGKYRWLVQSHSAEIKQFDGYGDLVTVRVSVELVEYLRE